MMITVEAFDVIAVGGAKMFEAAVVEPLGDDIAAIVRTIMPVPAIVVHVRNAVDATTFVMFNFGSRVALAMCWCLRYVALIALNAVVAFSGGPLSERWECHQKG